MFSPEDELAFSEIHLNTYIISIPLALYCICMIG